jgi:hypothetical protein
MGNQTRSDFPSDVFGFADAFRIQSGNAVERVPTLRWERDIIWKKQRFHLCTIPERNDQNFQRVETKQIMVGDAFHRVPNISLWRKEIERRKIGKSSALGFPSDVFGFAGARRIS